ncbi:MAG: zinc ribbon domain-containing protein [Chloroflexota bacterium]
MPIYEYVCLDCRDRVSVFFRKMSEASDDAARCPQCQGERLHRIVSRVAVMKSEDSRIESMMDDSSLMAGLENEDPRALAGFMRKMSDEMGEPMDAEMTEVVDRLESGESPEAIESTMPDLGGPDLNNSASLADSD